MSPVPLHNIQLVCPLLAGKLQFQALKSHTLCGMVSLDHISFNSLLDEIAIYPSIFE